MRGRLIVAFVVLLTLLPTSQAKALTIDLETLLKGVSQVLTDVGGSPGAAAGSEVRSEAGEQPHAMAETHPTPAVEQEGTLPPPPALAPNPRPQTAPPPQPTAAQVPPVLHRIAECESGGDWTAENPRSSASGNAEVIRCVFGHHGTKAVAVARCESTLRTTARNGQYRGLFQMGAPERAKYGHGSTALAQAEAAKRYFDIAGWRPWRACSKW